MTLSDENTGHVQDSLCTVPSANSSNRFRTSTELVTAKMERPKNSPNRKGVAAYFARTRRFNRASGPCPNQTRNNDNGNPLHFRLRAAERTASDSISLVVGNGYRRRLRFVIASVVHCFDNNRVATPIPIDVST